MNDTERILAAIAQGAQQQVNLQRSVDRIANDHVALRQDVVDIKGEVLSLGGRVSNLEGARRFSDRARADLSDTDLKHESDLSAVVVALEATKADVAEVKGQQHALMAVNQKQTGLLTLLRGSAFKRFGSELTKLVIVVAAILNAYLAAKGNK